MVIETLKTSELRKYEKNARTHPAKQVELLAKNIKRFGFTTPVLIDKTGEVIAGHGRLLALEKLGITDVPCVRMENLTPKEVKALRLADNQVSALSEWDMDLVLTEMKELDLEHQELTGFDIKELEPQEIVEDEAPPVPTETDVVLGDMFRLGDHVLLCGDATKVEDVERLMGGEKAELLLTDPPYGIGIANNPVRQKFAKSDWDDKVVDADALALGIASTGKAIVWGGNYFGLPASQGFFVWDKKQPEDFSLAMCEMAWTNIQMPAKIFEKSVTSYKKDHPTQKPVELLVWCMEKAKEAKTVLDLFGGSGSTLIACEQTGRKCRILEIDPRYVSVIIQRFENLTGKKAVKL